MPALLPLKIRMASRAFFVDGYLTTLPIAQFALA
jgi:hypothetical protein